MPSFRRHPRARRILRTALALCMLALLALTAIAMGRGHRPPRSDKDAITCLGKKATIVGTAGGDTLRGTRGNDVIEGGAGPDRITAVGGADLVCGGRGNDRIMGGAGDDRLLGEAGNDRIDGGGGADRCEGGGGRNTLRGCETPSKTQTTPVNRAPVGQGATATTDERSTVAIELLKSASDPDGDALEITALNTGGTRGSVTLKAGGVAVFDPSGRFAELAADESADTSFGYTVADGRGLSVQAQATVTVNGLDDPPIAVDDAATVGQDAAPASIDLLANDTDVDGGPRSIESVSQPEHGSVVVAEGGSGLSYQPASGYCNDGEVADTFTYTLNGGSTATVSVAVSCATTITASPALEPAFDPAIPDYTVRCDGDPIEMSGRTAAGAGVEIDGEAAESGQFEATVPLEEDQDFEFSVDEGTGPRAFHVRCLPSDFGAWEYERLKTPSHGFYVVSPTLGAGASPYAVIFDDHGVPVWWDAEAPAPASDAKVLADGSVVFWSSPPPLGDAYTIRDLDGTIQNVVRPPNGRIDPHEFQVEPNGDYLILTERLQENVDLTAFGGGPDDTVKNAVVEEVTPDGELVWEWSTEGHISLNETGRWWPTALLTPNRDVVHINAIEPVGDDAVLISLRHTDAVYKIDKATGEVIWKLGGTWTPKSLTVVGDPEGAYPLGGQHDVRLLPDGTITIHDNNTNLPDPPRAVRYQIDEAAKTATMVEQVTDPLAPSSFCCGSARRSADGSWLMSWGGRSLVTEFNAAGERTFRLGFGGTVFSYRAVPVPDGAVTVQALRAGMDSMHPR